MSVTTSDVQRDIALTRERMSETIAELDARIADQVSAVKEKLDVMRLVQDHPWPALAVAVGLGVLLAGTGADAKAAAAAARAAKAAPGTTADLARRGWDAASSRVRGNGDHEAESESSAAGLTDRVRETLTRALGVDELIDQMRVAAEDLVRPASYAGRDVPQNTGQQM